VHLKIDDKTPEQFDDDKKSQNIDDDDVERLADGLCKEKFLDPPNRMKKANNQHNNNKHCQDDDNNFNGQIKHTIHGWNFHYFFFFFTLA